MAEDCVHGMNPNWCAVYQKADHGDIDAPGNSRYYAGQWKQDLLNHVTDQLGLARETVGVGSSLPSTVSNLSDVAPLLSNRLTASGKLVDDYEMVATGQ